MTLCRHELRQGRLSLAIWALAIGGLMAACVFLFPEMKGEMGQMGEMFASMGALTAAFGLDRLNYGTFPGYYAIECGNILGLGGAMFAAMTASSALAKEEKEGTAEFLLTHPVSRAQVVTEKLLAVLVQILALNLAVLVISALTSVAIGEEIPWKELGELHLAYLFLQIELMGICFGLSAFLRRGSMGAGLGIAAGAYFLDLIANLAEKAEWLHYVTPFGYTSGGDILSEGLNWPLIALGILYAAIGVALAYGWYLRKDIR